MNEGHTFLMCLQTALLNKKKPTICRDCWRLGNHFMNLYNSRIRAFEDKVHDDAYNDAMGSMKP